MQDERFAQLLFDGVQRVERGHRLLENHRHAVSAQFLQPRRLSAQQLLTVEADAAVGVAGARVGQQLQHRERCNRLARAGFADQRHGLAAFDAERSTAHGLDIFSLDVEAHAQVFDGQQSSCAVLPGVGLARIKRVAHRLADKDQQRQHHRQR